MNGEIVLDYTTRAEPLTIGDIKADDDRMFAADLTVSRIVIWEHQWKHLVEEAGGWGRVALHLVRGERIWSIPISIRKRRGKIDFLVQH